ncbi:MAG: hypothetical protein IZT59_02090 [Verrucomicrobia bacterium]|jgi:hypothetical protein|nr:hypothetical protein [Verrucomicrobiota bacterium]|tara:strand:+ start:52851 stop:53129 length:279 start_codon:yes stop_codon:yes gene_type:complete
MTRRNLHNRIAVAVTISVFIAAIGMFFLDRSLLEFFFLCGIYLVFLMAFSASVGSTFHPINGGVLKSRRSSVLFGQLPQMQQRQQALPKPSV